MSVAAAVGSPVGAALGSSVIATKLTGEHHFGYEEKAQITDAIDYLMVIELDYW